MIFPVIGLPLLLWFPVCILCVGGDFYSKLPLPKERLFCDGDLPGGIYGDSERSWEIREGLKVVACGEWEPWCHWNFTDISDLCTIHGNPEGNYGGFVRYIALSPLTSIAATTGKLCPWRVADRQTH